MQSNTVQKDDFDETKLEAMYMTVPIISSFLSEEFPITQRHQATSLKRLSSYREYNKELQHICQIKANLRINISSPQCFSDGELVRIKAFQKKQNRVSPLAHFVNFLQKYPLIQLICFLAVVATLVAALSFAQDWVISDGFVQFRNLILRQHESTFYKIMMHILFVCIGGLIGTLLTTFLSPEAGSGSGIPEIKAILSGIPFPQFLTFRTLLAKYLGCMIAVGTGTFVGRTGPMTSVSLILTYLLIKKLPFFKSFGSTDSLLRVMLSYGIGVAYAATMYAPIGGVLFSIETTSSLFITRNYPRLFFAAGLSSLLFRITSFIDYSPLGVQPSSPSAAELGEYPIFIVEGIVIGFISRFFVVLARRCAIFYRDIERYGFFNRKKAKKAHPDKKITTSLDFPNKDLESVTLKDWILIDRTSAGQDDPIDPDHGINTSHRILHEPTDPSVFHDDLSERYLSQETTTLLTRRISSQPHHERSHLRRLNSICISLGSFLKKTYRRFVIVIIISFVNACLSIPVEAFDLSNSTSSTILMDMLRHPLPEPYRFSFNSHVGELGTLAVLLVCKFAIFPNSMQMAVPAGIVMPSLVIGSVLGRILGSALELINPTFFTNPQTFAAVGAASFLAAVTQTFSPALIVIETSCMPNISLPCVIGTLAAYFTHNALGDSIFEMITKFRNIPSLRTTLPREIVQANLTAADLAKSAIVYLPQISTFSEIKRAIATANNLEIPCIPLVQSNDNLTLLGSVTVESLQHLVDNPLLHEKCIIATHKQPPLLLRESIEQHIATGVFPTPEEAFQNIPRTESVMNAKRRKYATTPLGVGYENVPVPTISTPPLLIPASPSPGLNKQNYHLHFMTNPIYKSDFLAASSSSPFLTSFVTAAPSTLRHSVSHESDQPTKSDKGLPASFHRSFKRADAHRISTVRFNPPQFPSTRHRNWRPHDDLDFARLSLTSDFVVIDDTPFQLPKNTSLIKAHALFHILQLQFCILTQDGKFTHLLFQSDFTDLLRKEKEMLEFINQKKKHQELISLDEPSSSPYLSITDLLKRSKRTIEEATVKND
ncbi:putative Chloride channel protein clh-3 [Blattamonas nauphoetae]|uniref:Chloride channel protein clh-3 n=1 Tax=Blattamonas nauphoetae TaxID=2049346 RepID=A0ABQ9YHS1_9EUKA|nr:putative Chloride channel protein clh-3 [Blattamonas nauphoetae]